MEKPKNPLSKQDQSKAYGCFGLVILFVVLFFYFSSGSDENKETYDETSALVDSRQFVEKQLKSPSTAEFSNDLSGVKKYNDTTFIINSYVDSQNGFGAMIRSNYNCVLYYHPNSQTIEVKDLNIK